MEKEKIKYPIKSEKYKGVYQRKNGTWFYRVKKIYKNSGKPVYYHFSGFSTDKDAYESKITRLRLESWSKDAWEGGEFDFQEVSEIKFSDSFSQFLEQCESPSAKEKYKSIYKKHLSMWADRLVSTINDTDIDILLFRLAFQGYKQSFISSVRKLLKFYFKYARHVYHTSTFETAQFITTKPYKLRVLSLFSGIGAPERALEELREEIGLDFEVVNYCEFDDDASLAYSLLHNVNMDLDLIDVDEIDFQLIDKYIPDFDILFFGSPTENLSKNNTQGGFLKNPEDKLPSTWQLKMGDLPELNESGLIYRALILALHKRPKFMVADNVAGFINRSSREEFRAVVRNLQDIGYSFYYKKLNSLQFGLPQDNEKTYMVMVREDINIKFEWPQPQELTVNAEDWFLPPEKVSDEYYLAPERYRILEKQSHTIKFDRKIISCITTQFGKPDPYKNQTFVKDSKGIRCLTSEELMIFQGFPTEYVEILHNKGYGKEGIGKLVGNSIPVPVIKEIIKQLIIGVKENRAREIPGKVIEARLDADFIPPLFSYMGNKTKLLPYINYLLPIQDELFMDNFVFVDVFTGSGAVAVNVKANRVIMNDVDPFLINIYKGLSATPPDKAWDLVMNIIKKYNLSKYNLEGFEKCKEEYNAIPVENRDAYWYWGLVLVYHGFNRNHVSHNKKNNDFNTSFGKENVNLKVSKGRFFPFASRLYNGNFEFTNKSYKEVVVERKYLDEDIMYYFDPPYYKTKATYNKGWSKKDEEELYAFIDNCSKKGIKWMLSNVLENNGEHNPILAKWLKDNEGKYGVYYMNRKYTNCNHNRKNKGDTVEIIVTNQIIDTHF